MEKVELDHTGRISCQAEEIRQIRQFMALTKLFLKLSTVESKPNRKKMKPRGKDTDRGTGLLLKSPKRSRNCHGRSN